MYSTETLIVYAKARLQTEIHINPEKSRAGEHPARMGHISLDNPMGNPNFWARYFQHQCQKAAFAG
jgi:hypothetical protein